MADFEIWDVVRVPFPYTNRPVEQYRPALVVGSHRQAGSPALLWVLMITNAVHRRWEGDVVVSDLGAAGLPMASVVRSCKLTTIEAAQAARIGRLPTADCAAVRGEMKRVLASVIAVV